LVNSTRNSLLTPIKGPAVLAGLFVVRMTPTEFRRTRRK
jgi:hypothetical protein